MFQSIKRLTRHSIIYGLGHIFSRFIGFLLLPIHTNTLEPAAFGLASLLFSSLAILNIIFSYGMDVAFLRFFTLEDDRKKKQDIFSTAWWMILSTGLVFAAVLFFKPYRFSLWIFNDASHILLIRLAAGILLADALVLMPFLILRSQERSIAFTSIKFVQIGLNVGLNVLFIAGMGLGVTGIFYANLIASASALLMLMPVALPWIRFRFDGAVLKELLRFGLPYIPSGLAVVLMDQIGRFFLDRMAGKEATGLFSATYKLGMFMAIVVAAFRFAWHPFFLSTSKQQDASRIFSRILTYFILVTGWLFLMITFYLEQIIHLNLLGYTLFGEGYEGGLPIVPIILLAYICYGVYVNFIVGIYLEKKTHYLPLVTGAGAAVSVIMNFLLIPKWGIMGAAWASFFAYLTMAVVLYCVSHPFYPIAYEWKRILHLSVVIAGFFYAGMLLQHWALHLLMLILVLPVLWITKFFNANELAGLKQHLKLNSK